MGALLASLSGCNTFEEENVGTTHQAVKTGAVLTLFNPADGLNWENDVNLKNVWSSGILDLNLHTSALCGGMAFTMLDYFFQVWPVPNHFYAPATGTQLREYIYERQLTSLISTDNGLKWIELNQAEGRMARSLTGEYLKLKSEIDFGRPVVIGAQVRGGNKEGHQVIVYGYYSGSYQGDDGAGRDELELYVLDPNFKRTPLTLVFNEGGFFEYKEREGCVPGGSDFACMRFDGFFVEDYTPNIPPIVPSIPVYPVDALHHELAVEFINNGDGLDGGPHNINLTLHLADKSTREFTNLNGGAYWDGNGDDPGKETVQLLLDPPIPFGQILSATISNTFAGGIDGKNWDMGSVRIRSVRSSNEALARALNNDTNPSEFAGPHRFTGRDDPFRFLVDEKEGYVSKLQFTLETGENGIEAQPYNLWDAGEELEIIVHNSDGSIQIVPRVDQQLGVPAGSVRTFDVILDRPTLPCNLASIEIGVRRKNSGTVSWDLDKIWIRALGKGVGGLLKGVPCGIPRLRLHRRPFALPAIRPSATGTASVLPMALAASARSRTIGGRQTDA